MRILFLHPNFPAQFRHLATALAKDPQHQVYFGTMREAGSLPNVHKILYQPLRQAYPTTHRYVQSLENAVLHGQGAYRMAQTLRSQGIVPDLIYGHSGWGPTLFMRDLFPRAKLICYFEWFYRAYGSDADFDPLAPLDADAAAKIRVKNAAILLDLASCDRGLCPTYWQRRQFPIEFHPKLKVQHDGIDTAFFRPKLNAKLLLRQRGLDLSGVDELVTYATRGMEPYRGFPQFMAAAALIQQRRPRCHVVVMGDDCVAYGKSLPNGQTYKQRMLATLPLDRSRLHFTGALPYPQYLQVLQASDVHIYLTYPFVLSWSLLEAMAAGCLVIGSRTPPVMEVIKDNTNGLLADFFSPQQLADQVDAMLDHPNRMAQIRQQARETIVQRYALSTVLPQQIEWLLSAGN